MVKPAVVQNNIILSKRYELLKEADFFSGFLKTIKDKVQLREKPFETIFGLIGPFVAKSWTWRILLLVLEYMGYGPGLIGKWIDKSLGFGGTTAPSLSTESLKNAATGVVDRILKTLGLKEKSASMNLSVRGGRMITKEAGIFSFLGKVIKGKRVGLINWIYTKLLKPFAAGLVGLGIIGGATSAIKGEPGIGEDDSEKITWKPSAPSPSPLYRADRQYIANEMGNVEDTVIYFLNSKISGFSKGFKAITKNELKGSRQMRELLKDIEAMNTGATLAQLDGEKSFITPSIMSMAKELLPGTKFTPLAKKMPKKKVNTKPPGGAKKLKVNKKQRMLELAKKLQGVK